jgi:hypothetical protein
LALLCFSPAAQQPPAPAQEEPYARVMRRPNPTVLRVYREASKKIRILHFDSHLDFSDGREPVRLAHGNPMRRSFELPWVSGLTSIWIRGLT